MQILYSFGHLAKDVVEDFVREVAAFLYRADGGNDADVYLRLSRQPYTGDDASAKVDQTAIWAGYVGIRIEHKTSIGE